MRKESVEDEEGHAGQERQNAHGHTVTARTVVLVEHALHLLVVNRGVDVALSRDAPKNDNGEDLTKEKGLEGNADHPQERAVDGYCSITVPPFPPLC